MNMRRRVFLYAYMLIILCNGHESREDRKLAEEYDTGSKNALVAVGTEDDEEDTLVEGIVFDVAVVLL